MIRGIVDADSFRDVREFLDTVLSDYQKLWLTEGDVLNGDGVPIYRKSKQHWQQFVVDNVHVQGKPKAKPLAYPYDDLCKDVFELLYISDDSFGRQPKSLSPSSKSSSSKTKVGREHCVPMKYRSEADARGEDANAGNGARPQPWHDWRSAKHFDVEANMDRQFTHHRNELAAGRKVKFPPNPTYYGSYAPDGLAMALYSVYTTSTFNEAVAKVVNMQGDADTTGAIAGQIAGAFYGYSAIDARWKAALKRTDPDYEVARRALLLTAREYNA